MCHNIMSDELGALCAAALIPKDVSHKPLITYGKKFSARSGRYQEENRVGSKWVEEGKEFLDGAGGLVCNKDGESWVGMAADIENYAQSDRGVHGFWRHGTACIFEIQVTELDA